MSVPSRRSSCSPATSNASSSTTNPASLLGDQLLQPPPQIVTALASPVSHFSPPNKSSPNGVSNGNGHCKASPKASPRASPKTSPKGSQTQTASLTNQNATCGLTSSLISHNNVSKQDSNKTSPASTNGNGNLNGIHNQKHPKNHHANNGTGHRKLRIASQTHELTAEDLKRMLELVSDLSYLKLVSMKSTATTTSTTTTNGTSTGSTNQYATQCNGIVINQIYPDKECQNRSENRLQQSTTNGSQMLQLTKPGSYIGSPSSTNTSSIQCIPYIFEKVDYIKKISVRRKALKKFKKARKKSRSIISPNTTESPSLKL